MSKIKETLEKLRSQGHAYHDLQLLVAKRTWLIVASLYYLSFLFTVGGFYVGPLSLSTLSKATFHLYSILVIVTGWMIYAFGEYLIAINKPDKKSLLFIPGVIAGIFVIVALVAHFGLI